jgi:putative DNA primase/helicase
MRRSKPGEKGARFRFGKTPELSELARKAARFVAENARAIECCEPFLPNNTPDRVADNWESLLAVAEVAGDDIADRARRVMLEACGVEADAEQGFGTLLLADVRDVLTHEGVDKISSAQLVDALAAMPERPWSECRKGKPVNQNWLARRLRDFGIYSRNLKIAGQVPKGYHASDFQDAFSRYLPEPPSQTATPLLANEINNLDGKQSATWQDGVAVQKPSNLLKTNEVAAVAAQNAESGAR